MLGIIYTLWFKVIFINICSIYRGIISIYTRGGGRREAGSLKRGVNYVQDADEVSVICAEKMKLIKFCCMQD